jgi:hypothetical protein
MTLFHGSYKKIENFTNAPIWCSNLFDTANNYILCQSEGEGGEFGFIYEVEVDEKEIINIDDFVAVDCGSILDEMEGNVFSAESEYGDRIFVIRNASKYSFKEVI